MCLKQADNEFDVENNFLGRDQDQGPGPEFPQIVPKILKIFKNDITSENCSKSPRSSGFA